MSATLEIGRPTSPKTPRRPTREPPAANGLSALAAAAKVVAAAKHPLTVREIVERMAERGLWVSPAGLTPQATLSSAITREIVRKGPKSRFRKTGRGLFAAVRPAAAEASHVAVT